MNALRKFILCQENEESIKKPFKAMLPDELKELIYFKEVQMAQQKKI